MMKTHIRINKSVRLTGKYIDKKILRIMQDHIPEIPDKAFVIVHHGYENEVELTAHWEE